MVELKEPSLQPTLVGELVVLRPLASDDFEALSVAASDPLIWEQHPDSRRCERDVFMNNFFRGALSCESALIVEEKDSGRIIGSSRFYEWDRVAREMSIGYTFITRDHWGDGTNDEMKVLMLNYVFEFTDKVWFHVGEENQRSRRAVEKLGAVLDHQRDRNLDGKAFVQLYYKLPKASWKSATN